MDRPATLGYACSKDGWWWWHGERCWKMGLKKPMGLADPKYCWALKWTTSVLRFLEDDEDASITHPHLISLTTIWPYSTILVAVWGSDFWIPRLFQLLFCKELSGLGLRHVGYGVPTELFSPYVSSAVEASGWPGDWLGQLAWATGLGRQRLAAPKLIFWIRWALNGVSNSFNQTLKASEMNRRT